MINGFRYEDPDVVAYNGWGWADTLRDIIAGNYKDVAGVPSARSAQYLYEIAEDLEKIHVARSAPPNEFSTGATGQDIAAFYASCSVNDGEVVS